jgi:hypothetical protein
MEAVLYRAHLIYARAQRTSCLDYWLPFARVSWDEKGAPRQSILSGHSSWCKSEDEAALYALTMAKTWIDEHSGQSTAVAATQAA